MLALRVRVRVAVGAMYDFPRILLVRIRISLRFRLRANFLQNLVDIKRLVVSMQTRSELMVTDVSIFSIDTSRHLTKVDVEKA